MKKLTKGIIIALVGAVAMTGKMGMTADAKDSADYNDVDLNAWYGEYVTYVAEKEYMTGLNVSNFGVDTELARSQFATILYRIEGEPEVQYEEKFSDVGDGEWYSNAITWANQQGIVTGYDDSDLFGTADSITREQMATMMYRYAKYKGLDIEKQGNADVYPDVARISKFSYQPMRWAFAEGIISGDSGNANPQGVVNRAVGATMLTRLDRNVLLEDMENGYFYIGNQRVHFDFPESWQGNYDVWYSPNNINFYCRPLAGMDGTGTFWYANIGGIQVRTDHDVDNNPLFTNVGENAGFYYYATQATDVTYDDTISENKELYMSMAEEEWEAVRNSMTFINAD